MKPPEFVNTEAAAYDPSYRRADSASYWQWTNSELGGPWERAAEYVNMGWPAQCEIKDRSARWYGVIFTHPDDFWIYRVFAAGKDRFGRAGRYFFVLIRLRSLEGLLSPQVAGLFSYFDGESGLPLKTEPLDQGWQDAPTDEILKAINEELLHRGRTGHWGMDTAREIAVFSEWQPEPPELLKPISHQAPRLDSSVPSQRRKNRKLKYVGIGGAVVVALLLLRPNYTHRQIDTSPKVPSSIQHSSTEVLSADQEEAKGSEEKVEKPQEVERPTGEHTDSKPKPIIDPKELPNPDSIPKETDDSVIPDQTPDSSPNSSAGSTKTETKP